MTHAMTDKQRVLGVLEGRPVDRFPVAAPYIWLVQIDHWCEITGQPAWTYHDWLIQDPAEHVQAYVDFDQLLPFDILQPHLAPSRERRESLQVVHEDGAHYYHDARSGEKTLLKLDLPHIQEPATETRSVFDRSDVDRLVEIRSTDELLEAGHYDFMLEAIKVFGDRKFILSGVVGTFFQCTRYTGETNLFTMLYDAPDLIHYLSAKILERSIEQIRALAAVGHDAIYVDDAMTTSDMISVDFYERFCMPYTKAMVDEIHSLGKKAKLIYFGGVTDRIPQILSIGADMLNVEATMKGYINDLCEISSQVGDQTCLWGNIDPVWVVQNGTDALMCREIAQQVDIGKRTGKFIVSTGSPLTPLTPLPRIQRFIALGRQLGASSLD